MNKFKRLIALLLVVATVLSLMGSAAPAVIEEAAVSEPAVEEIVSAAGVDVYDYSADVGKYVRFDMSAWQSILASADPSTGDTVFASIADYAADYTMTIIDWYVDESTTEIWYKVVAAEGYELTEDLAAYPWVLQNIVGESTDPDTFIFVPTCDICGKPDCDKTHVQCPVCGAYDCDKTHIYCPVCGDADCNKTHVYCSICEKYDCGEVHEDIYTPDTAPVIPEYSLKDGEEIAIVDKEGVRVDAADGFVVPGGFKTGLSVFSEYDEHTDVSYKWQVRYDAAEDLWADIRGQQGKGILMSPAMFLSLIEDGINPAIRCVVSSDGTELVSEAIPVTIGTAANMASSTYADTPVAIDLAEGDEEPELSKSYVVVQYVYSDGRTAATTDFAEIIGGSAYSHVYTLPAVTGYKATLNTHVFGDDVTLNGNTLTMNFDAGELTDEYTIFTVTYEPDFVNYTVIHYWQNVDNDNYTEHERETIGNTHKTGEQIKDVENEYPGFYNLLYETPAAAADGSTVMEVYYDRYYYLMTFDLDDMGYGVDPIYARYGDTVEIGTPTRAGYTFLGWDKAITDTDGDKKFDQGDGTVDSVPDRMPAENSNYIAVWRANDTAKVSVVIWGENADDEGYSYIKTNEIYVKPGETISWDSWCFVNCSKSAHTHNALCGYNCGIEEHVHNSSCYTLICTTKEHTTHTDSCYNCGRQEHTEHTDACCEYGGTGRGHRRHNDNCCTEGGTHTHSSSCGYNCTLHAHSVDDGCYTLSCDKDEHPHTAACGYACGVTEEHVHTSACGNDQSGMSTSLWTLVKSDEVKVDAAGNTVLNVYYDRTTFTLTFRENGNTVATIVEKWGADISDEFMKAPFNTTYNGRAWRCTEDDKYGYALQTLDRMPQFDATFNLYNQSSDTLKTIYYYVENVGANVSETEWPSNATNFTLLKTVDTYFNYATYQEEYHEIEGFKRYSATVAGFSGSQKYFSNNTLYLYYLRESNTVEFSDGYMIKNSGSVEYGATLSAYSDYIPTLPSAYEAGSRVFAGWYLNPECTGERVDLNEFTMPAENLILYAKWEPVSRKVNYYMTKESLDRGENIPAEMLRLATAAGRENAEPYTTVFAGATVKHGAFIEKPDDPGVSEGYANIHPRAGYDFAGWFYIDENGEEKAFDPENMPVTQDLNLYAKWSADKLCAYNIYFALDANNDGVADTDGSGNVIYIADPVSGSGIAGRTYTFSAKGGEELYEGYSEGYFPTVGSHSLTIDVQDEYGTGANSFTFLYRQRDAVPYTVRYVDKETGDSLIPDKVVTDNKNVVVTENYQYIQSYMPDAYQKTLVITDDDNAANDEIIFYYTKDNEHSLYVVNHYIQELNDDLTHKGWTKYTDLQNTGDIGTEYTANAITIDGFTLSKSYTDGYNVTDKKNGMTGDALPTTPISALSDDSKLSGTLSDKVMELNFYYTRNLYPYEFRFMLNGTTTELADPEFGKAGYDTTVTEAYKEIVMDLDGDGVNEDYRLYDPTETSKDIHIKKDGEPLAANDTVVKGQAKINVATFYYVRCTQTMTITKTVVDNSAFSDPDLNQDFDFSLLIHSNSGYHMQSYNYTKSDGTSGTLSPVISAPNTLRFSLKHDETITIEGLPTAEYTVSELNLPTGYYDIAGTNVRNKLTVDDQLDVTVTNSYEPAKLRVTKSYAHDANQEFDFTVTFSDGTIESFKLRHGETKVFENAPLGAYSVTEGELPLGVYQTGANNATGELKRGDDITAAFTNSYEPAKLVLGKGVYVVEDNNIAAESGNMEITDFEFTITFPDGVTPAASYAYTVSSVSEGVTVENPNRTATVEGNTMKITLQKSQLATFINLPTGNYTIAETDYGPNGYNTYYIINPVGDQFDSWPVGLVSNPPLTRGETTTVYYANMFPVDDLDIYKTVKEEYAGEVWEDRTFTFTVERSDKALTAGAVYEVLLDGTASGTATVTAEKTLEVTVTFTAEEGAALDAAGESLTKKLTIMNLPVGNYTVTEAANNEFMQTASVGHTQNGSYVKDFDDSDLAAEVALPCTVEGATPAVAFENTVKRSTGNLQLSKQIIVEEGHQAPAGIENEQFEFVIELTDGTIGQGYELTVKHFGTDEKIDTTDDTVVYATKDAAITEGALKANADGTLTLYLKHGQYANLTKLPIGSYTVTEKAKEGYGSSFNDIPGSTDAAQDITITKQVLADKLQDLPCYNRYPHYNGTLVVKKSVENAGKLPEDVAPADAEFTYTVTLTSVNVKEGDVFNFEKLVDGTSATGTLTLDAKKQLSFSLKHGEEITIEKLPTGDYTVTETGDHLKHYTVISEKLGDDDVVIETGNETITGTIAADDTDTIVFTNTYKQHLANLTISKTRTGSTSEAQSFVFEVKGESSALDCGHDGEVTAVNMRVVVNVPAGSSESSVTVYGLPVGNYTVTEVSDWSWRYVPKNASQTIVLSNHGSVSFTNTLDKLLWLSGDCYANNHWDNSGISASGQVKVENKPDDAGDA
ncbi:MAG: InlB B-repeat-containing protein [Oscillospiraceae bacterium]|nr:InlB B-repeat-containing protein [Oscillospiraceae bacterium]